MLFSRPGIFGIDVGFETLKIVQLHRQGRSFRIWGQIEVPLPSNSVSKNGIANASPIAETLTKSLAEAKPHSITAKRVFAALPESLTFTKTVNLPLTKPKEIKQALTLQAADFLPVSPAEVYLDFAIIHTGPAGSEILVVAQHRKLVDSFIELLTQAKLHAQALETKQIALAKLLLPANYAGNCIIVDVGAKISKVSLFEGGNLITTATVSIGAKSIQAGQAIDMLITAIRNLEQYRSNQLKKPLSIHQVKVTGAGAHIEGITDSLQVALGVPTEIAAPWLSIQGFDHKFAAATGLALNQFK